MTTQDPYGTPPGGAHSTPPGHPSPASGPTPSYQDAAGYQPDTASSYQEPAPGYPHTGSGSTDPSGYPDPVSGSPASGHPASAYPSSGYPDPAAGSGYPPAGGYPPPPPPGYPPPPPPGYPPGGGYGPYQPPPGYGMPSGPYLGGGVPPYRADDPLIAYDFGSWFSRVLGVVKRSWKRMLALTVLGAVLPALGVIAVVVGIVLLLVFLVLARDSGDSSPAPVILLIVPAYLIGVVAVAYFLSVTNIAVVKVATTDAAGHRIGLMDAFKSSLSLGWPTLGWVVLGGLATGLGLLLCILPGLYMMVATSLIVPVMAFERSGGLAGSFRWIHSNFWPAAGRVAILYAAVWAVSMVVSTLTQVLQVPVTIGLESGDGSAPSPAALVLLIVVAVLSLLVQVAVSLASQVVMQAGYLVTYAELRGRMEPQLSTAQLAAQVNA